MIVTNADPLIDSFRYGSITPFTLAAGQTYIVGAADLAYYRDPIPTAGTLATAPGLTYLGSRYYRGTELHFPAGETTTKWIGANILLGSAVPEPATWAMMIIGFGAAGGAIRASRRRNALTAV
ncbi:PEPxxWA-CTERM sorting domain-containing protein [Phenylobacterium sp.]|uniref:PEPxxWA-CTERM sorting domain-containing protein n=1 Tax=Phenylobacterium sp. TaxID=1871053 RepID=UPI0025FCA525|nr:PEPxxWA-CTERM sorting domain-containing protein [Phenylobacterium sp.]